MTAIPTGGLWLRLSGVVVLRIALCIAMLGRVALSPGARSTRGTSSRRVR